MKIPFFNIFKSQSKVIPGEVKKQLESSFPNAKNIDWEVKNDVCEAIFYLNDIEHIAQISKKGILLEYKKNLWPDELPEAVKTASANAGEIMNAIVIFKGKEVFYEVIVRNEKLDRFENLYKENGELLKSALL